MEFVNFTSRGRKPPRVGPRAARLAPSASHNPNGRALPDGTVTSMTGEAATLLRRPTGVILNAATGRIRRITLLSGDCGLTEPSAADK
jgi:hypothetical protein